MEPLGNFHGGESEVEFGAPGCGIGVDSEDEFGKKRGLGADSDDEMAPPN